MTSLRHVVIAFGGFLSLSLLGGCSYSYTFEVSGVVKSAKTGEPIPGVEIYSLIDGWPDERAPERPAGPCATTGKDGTFSFEVPISAGLVDRTHDARWVLFFARDGFKSQNVDLKTVRAPKSTKTKGTVCVIVDLKD
jgi:hypothetical protein